MATKILYHNDMDGWAAAQIAKRALNNAEIIPVQYGEKPPEIGVEHDVYILDFSYPREILLGLAEKSKSLVVLDHHKTAQKELEGLDFAKFDIEKCGAVMTWDYFFSSLEYPPILKYIQDRDLWLWKQFQSREINAALRSYPIEEPWPFLDYDASQVAEMAVEGAAILREQARHVKAKISQAFEEELAGYKILAVNETYLISEVAGELAKGRPFGVCFFETGDRKVFSLRSDENGVDVSEIAKKFGGGGHKHAAGFSVNRHGFLLKPV